MNAEIITIGDELLLGQVIDTNSSWLGQELNKIGLRVHYKSAISDSREAILSSLFEASKRSNVIIITGGLGPTKDDITKTTMCEFFKSELVLNQKVLEWVQSIFKNRNLPMLESNNQQAMVPKNCEVLWNRNGTAPGMWFYENGVAYISMPGVPFEMKTIFEEEVVSKIKTVFKLPSIVHRTFQTIGIGESFLAKRIAVLEDILPTHIKLADLPAVGSVRLRFSAFGENKEELELELQAIVAHLYQLIGEAIFAEGEKSIAEVVGDLLNVRKKTIATAESCTGGFLAHQITLVPGSSNYFVGSILSYANQIKINEIGVAETTINENGAVSEACVIEMASKIRTKFKTDYALATSGIAGPGGGTKLKPVGTVWISLATPTQVIAKCFQFGDNRERTIQRSALAALEMLRQELLNA